MASGFDEDKRKPKIPTASAVYHDVVYSQLISFVSISNRKINLLSRS